MSKEKKYYVTIRTTVFAKNDRQAMLKAARLAEEIELTSTEGSDVLVQKLEKERIGTICEGQIYIMDNKIILAG
jgi:hypothetical protein